MKNYDGNYYARIREKNKRPIAVAIKVFVWFEIAVTAVFVTGTVMNMIKEG